MDEVQNEATYICNKYKNHIEPIQFEWDKFLPTLEKDFPDLLNEVLSYTNNQLHQPIANIKSSTPNENRNQYNTVIANTTRTLTNLSPLATNTNEARGYEHILHGMLENKTHMVETIILHTTHTGNGKIEDITTTQHHLDCYIQAMISETYTIGGQPVQAIGFITPIHVSIPIMSFTHITIMKITDKNHKNIRTTFEGNS